MAEATAIVYRRGDVVWAADPFRPGSDPRPWLVLSDDSHPFQGEEYLCVALTATRRVPAVELGASDWVRGTRPGTARVNPWTAMTVKHDRVAEWQGTLAEPVVNRVADELALYAGPLAPAATARRPD